MVGEYPFYRPAPPTPLYGKFVAIWPTAFNRKKIHMGCTGREFGPLLPLPARSIGLDRIWGLFWPHRPPGGVEQMFENPPGVDNFGRNVFEART